MKNKIYGKMKKRLAKKLMGAERWYLLQRYINGEVEPGKIVHTCRGYNEVVLKAELEWTKSCNWKRNLKHGWWGVDVTVDTTGGSCSMTHCLTFPLPTKEQILGYFKYLSRHPNREWDFGHIHNMIIEKVSEDVDPFDENGCLLNSVRFEAATKKISDTMNWKSLGKRKIDSKDSVTGENMEWWNDLLPDVESCNAEIKRTEGQLKDLTYESFKPYDLGGGVMWTFECEVVSLEHDLFMAKHMLKVHESKNL